MTHIPEFAEALNLIKSHGMNLIHCSMTGQEIGIVHDSEIVSCLDTISRSQGTFNPESLVDHYQLNYYVMSSSMCPSLRVHRDSKQWLRVLQADVTGPAKLLSFMLGRLFFEHDSDPRVQGSKEIFARINFVVQVKRRIDALPETWFESLTADDEETKISAELARMLGEAAGIQPTIGEECKAAQHMLEALLRLEATSNVRAMSLPRSIRARMNRFVDGIDDEWTFSTLDGLISEVEDSRIRNPELFNNRVTNNRLLIEAAGTALQWELSRIGELQDRYQKVIDREGDKTTRGEGVFDRLRAFGLESNPNRSTATMAGVDLDSLQKMLSRLSADLSIVSWSERRLEVLRRSTANESVGGKVIKRTGASAAKALIESGTPMDPEYTLKLMEIVDAANVKRKAGRPASSTPGKRATRSKFADLFADVSRAMGNDKLNTKE